ncbi:hypothetical protein BJV74DRAFT_796567 [Russula compacta]|nr:hypothetical protein BJV74DRAFT_796567 [Russula compacta]
MASEWEGMQQREAAWGYVPRGHTNLKKKHLKHLKLAPPALLLKICNASFESCEGSKEIGEGKNANFTLVEYRDYELCQAACKNISEINELIIEFIIEISILGILLLSGLIIWLCQAREN